jgi:hypothetical protein
MKLGNLIGWRAPGWGAPLESRRHFLNPGPV